MNIEGKKDVSFMVLNCTEQSFSEVIKIVHECVGEGREVKIVDPKKFVFMIKNLDQNCINNLNERRLLMEKIPD